MKKIYQITATSLSQYSGNVQLTLVPGDETETTQPRAPGDKIKEAISKYSDTIPKDIQALMGSLAEAMAPPPGMLVYGPPRESSIVVLRQKEYEQLGRPSVGQFMVFDLEVMKEGETLTVGEGRVIGPAGGKRSE